MTETSVSLEALIELLDEDGTRQVLERTYDEPASPAEIADVSSVSLTTVCRRIEDLEAAGLIEGQTRIREDGHHDTVYSAQFEGLLIDLDEDGFSYDLERREDPIDRLHRLWGEF